MRRPGDRGKGRPTHYVCSPLARYWKQKMYQKAGDNGREGGRNGASKQGPRDVCAVRCTCVWWEDPLIIWCTVARGGRTFTSDYGMAEEVKV